MRDEQRMLLLQTGQIWRMRGRIWKARIPRGGPGDRQCRRRARLGSRRPLLAVADEHTIPISNSAQITSIVWHFFRFTENGTYLVLLALGNDLVHNFLPRPLSLRLVLLILALLKSTKVRASHHIPTDPSPLFIALIVILAKALRHKVIPLELIHTPSPVCQRQPAAAAAPSELLALVVKAKQIRTVLFEVEHAPPALAALPFPGVSLLQLFFDREGRVGLAESSVVKGAHMAPELMFGQESLSALFEPGLFGGGWPAGDAAELSAAYIVFGLLYQSPPLCY